MLEVKDLMAPRDPPSVRALLPALLARLARERGGAAGLESLWAEVAGAALSRAAHPVGVEEKALVVAPVDAAWGRALAGHLPELSVRLAERSAGELTAVRLGAGAAR